MAIDYQQILMDMNRPHRRQTRSGRKLLVAAILCLVLGGGSFAIWRSGVAIKAWSKGSAAIATLWALVLPGGQSSVGATAEPEMVADNQGAVDMTGQANSPRPFATAPVSQSNSPINVVEAANSASSVAGTSQPARSVAKSNPAPTGSLRSSQPVSAPTAGGGAEAVPVLSDTRAQLRAIDQILADNPAEALRRVESLIQSKLSDDDAAEAGYRLGYAARMLRDEAKAETAWRDTAEKWPTYRGGRFSALALADTWFHRYATTRPQLSYWDDIQSLYSRVLGTDDAPFLPEQVKAKVKANLNTINESIIFGSGPTKLARYHKVESGELLSSIAGKYRADYESIARINGINPDRIRVGMDLKVIVGDVGIVVRKNSGDPSRSPTLTWYLDGRWIREYPTCVGDGNKTPAGTYVLVSKERDPSWTNPVNGQLLSNEHPENILGSRWMAMKGMNTQGLGIHGTTVDDSIPGYTSAGCIRLHNKDVEELFSYSRINAKVTVLE